MMSGLPDTPETRAVIRTVTERVLARIERGEHPPARTTPRSKGDFPKVLCLDQNKWIDLARAHYGRAEGAPFVDALAAVRAAVAANKLIVPIMPSNLIEASEPNDEARRQRISQFMVDTSGNHAFLNPKPITRLHIQRAVRETYLGETVDSFPRERLIAWGLEHALGRKMTGDEVLVQALAEPEISVLSLVHAVGRDGIAQGREMDERAASAARRARTNRDEVGRVKEELSALFASGSFADEMHKELDKLKIDRNAFNEWLESNHQRFADAIPDVDVQLRLLIARDRNDDHATHRNDLKDFMFLEFAVPYGNIVVTENSWAHLLRSEKLDAKYGTVVTSDARELPDLLKGQGCIA